MFQCPKCKDADNVLTIHALVRTAIEVNPDESVVDFNTGDLEWENTTEAECSCGWSGTVQGMTVEDPIRFRNFYRCECGTEWSDEWSCMCNDRCPSCNTEMTPVRSEDMGQEAGAA